MLLDFLKLVTDGWFLDIVTSGGFLKVRVVEGCDIRFFEACDRRVVPGERDIKCFLQCENFQWTCHYIF